MLPRVVILYISFRVPSRLTMLTPGRFSILTFRTRTKVDQWQYAPTPTTFFMSEMTPQIVLFE